MASDIESARDNARVTISKQIEIIIDPVVKDHLRLSGYEPRLICKQAKLVSALDIVMKIFLAFPFLSEVLVQSNMVSSPDLTAYPASSSEIGNDWRLLLSLISSAPHLMIRLSYVAHLVECVELCRRIKSLLPIFKSQTNSIHCEVNGTSLCLASSRQAVFEITNLLRDFDNEFAHTVVYRELKR
jgi:hypothetical protein